MAGAGVHAVPRVGRPPSYSIASVTSDFAHTFLNWVATASASRLRPCARSASESPWSDQPLFGNRTRSSRYACSASLVAPGGQQHRAELLAERKGPGGRLVVDQIILDRDALREAPHGLVGLAGCRAAISAARWRSAIWSSARLELRLAICSGGIFAAIARDAVARCPRRIEPAPSPRTRARARSTRCPVV